jgi:glycosyltransferase involved in cell wall biosynthesis
MNAAKPPTGEVLGRAQPGMFRPRARPPLKLLIVGNGPTALAADGAYHLERPVGQFLIDLAETGNDVTFLQPIQQLRPDANYFGSVMPPDSARIIGYRRRRPVSLARNAVAILSVLMRADFVYLFYPGTLPRLIARACRLFGKRYGLYLRGEQFTEARDGPTIRGARFILSVSKSLLSGIGGAGRDAVVIRPMTLLSADDAVRRSFAERGDRPLRLLFVGRLEAGKGTPELIEAAEILQRRGVNFELTLVGGGPLHPMLARRFSSGPPGPVKVMGAVEDREWLMRAYEEADLLILPTHHEGFPRVLYEAMIKSAVVITTMVGGIPSLMKDGHNCLAIPVGDAAAIADAVERLAGDAALMQRLAAAGLATVLNVLQDNPPHVVALQRGLAALDAASPDEPVAKL